MKIVITATICEKINLHIETDKLEEIIPLIQIVNRCKFEINECLTEEKLLFKNEILQKLGKKVINKDGERIFFTEEILSKSNEEINSLLNNIKNSQYISQPQSNVEQVIAKRNDFFFDSREHQWKRTLYTENELNSDFFNEKTEEEIDNILQGVSYDCYFILSKIHPNLYSVLRRRGDFLYDSEKKCLVKINHELKMFQEVFNLEPLTKLTKEQAEYFKMNIVDYLVDYKGEDCYRKLIKRDDCSALINHCPVGMKIPDNIILLSDFNKNQLLETGNWGYNPATRIATRLR